MSKGYDQLDAHDVFVKEDEIVIIGQPKEDDEHNCDYMGCSSVQHVIYRAKVSNVRKG